MNNNIDQELWQGVSKKIKEAVSESESKEIPEWHNALAEVYTTLQDPYAPDDAKTEAAIQCWKLSEHPAREVEARRQLTVAANGTFPFVYGLLIDLVASSPLEEARWRAARALVQLTYANPYAAWCVAGNAGREARARRRELEARAGRLAAELRKGAADGRDAAALRREMEECRRRAREVRRRPGAAAGRNHRGRPPR